jgi:hypothetical protein
MALQRCNWTLTQQLQYFVAWQVSLGISCGNSKARFAWVIRQKKHPQSIAVIYTAFWETWANSEGRMLTQRQISLSMPLPVAANIVAQSRKSITSAITSFKPLDTMPTLLFALGQWLYIVPKQFVLSPACSDYNHNWPFLIHTREKELIEIQSSCIRGPTNAITSNKLQPTMRKRKSWTTSVKG